MMIVRIQMNSRWFFVTYLTSFSAQVLYSDSRCATSNRKDVLWENVLRPVRQKCKGEERPGERPKDERRGLRRWLGMKTIRFLDSSWVSFNSYEDFVLQCFCLRALSVKIQSRSNRDISGFVDKIAHFVYTFNVFAIVVSLRRYLPIWEQKNSK